MAVASAIVEATREACTSSRKGLTAGDEAADFAVKSNDVDGCGQTCPSWHTVKDLFVALMHPHGLASVGTEHQERERESNDQGHQPRQTKRPTPRGVKGHNRRS
jgi:hypothetical protein